MSETTPLAYSIPEAVKASGLPRTSLYEAAKQGRLTFRKSGRRSVILAADLRALLESLPPARIRIKAAA